MIARRAGMLALIAFNVFIFFSHVCLPALAIPDRGLITGYVLDEDGNPVSAADVTLWHDGQFWQASKVTYAGSTNPQASDIHNGNEGYFIFGFVEPGNYTVRAEKDGCTGTAQFVSGTTNVLQNVTIWGYYVPSFTAEQLAYTGAITGTVFDSGGQDMTGGANVSLWRDGQMIKMPGNPQLGIGSQYLFEHLPPGLYEVRAVMQYVKVLRNAVGKAQVNISGGTATADIVLPFAALRPPPTLLPTPSPIPATQPTPSPGVALSMLSLCFAAVTIGLLRRRL